MPTTKKFEPLWNRPLRRPLYDPPLPPPKKTVKKPPPPIRAKLLATMIELGKSMAMLQIDGRDVVFLKEGDPLGTDNPNAKIAEFSNGKIVILQGDHKTQLTVPGSGEN